MGNKIKSKPLRAAVGVATLGGSEIGTVAKKLGIGLEDEQGEYNTTGNSQDFYKNYAREMGLAEKGVQEGALTKGVYGTDGLQAQLGTEGKDLASRGFQLTQDDREAYGQVSGDVARMYGEQEQAASQSLARRGLASANSGAAGATFSGLQGNKNEMLAKAQMGIAQKRMENTTQRLQENRRLQANLATQGSSLAHQRYTDKGEGLLKVDQLRGMDMAAKKAAVKPGLFSTIGQGLQAGIGNLATQAPGMLVGMPTMPSGGGAPTAAPASGGLVGGGPTQTATPAGGWNTGTSPYAKKNNVSSADWGGW
jgi:hypothetical protein